MLSPVEPASWGELATDNIILLVPTAELQDREDPEPLLDLWDEMMQAIARLAFFLFHRSKGVASNMQISADGCVSRCTSFMYNFTFFKCASYMKNNFISRVRGKDIVDMDHENMKEVYT